MNIQTRGIIYGIVSAVSYGMNPLFALFLYQDGLRVDSVLFYRYLLAVLMLGGMMKVRGDSFSLKKSEIAPLAILGFLFAASSFCLFSSFHYIEAGIASTLLFVYPIMVAVIMAFFFKERISWGTTFSILLSIVGILLLYKRKDGTVLNMTGVWLVMLSSLSYAIYIVAVNRSVLRDMPSFKLTFYVLLFCVAAILLYSGVTPGIQLLTSSKMWFIAVLLALIPTVILLVTMVLSVHYIGSTPTAILGALEPVTALFFGVMIFGEELTLRIVCGILLIILSVVLIILGKSLQRRLRSYLRKI